jgi:hypothetical protein
MKKTLAFFEIVIIMIKKEIREADGQVDKKQRLGARTGSF